jgi:redox-sensitive bicupin YhaK (pirin superfamily)
MMTLIQSKDRGLANHGWLKSFHTFSFADYYNPERMGFGPLRVINEDRIEAGTGFGTHPHRDMEIISYVIDGALEHKDSMGTETIIRPGDVQRMSAGTGIRHSEYNHSKTQQTHFLQIWVVPENMGIPPSYDQKSFETSFQTNALVLVGSKTGRDGSITINQDVDLYACKSNGEGSKLISDKSNRRIWVQNIKGQVTVNEQLCQSGDAVGFEKTESVSLKWSAGSEFLVFDLP